jgi:hypothetical protein
VNVAKLALDRRPVDQSCQVIQRRAPTGAIRLKPKGLLTNPPPRHDEDLDLLDDSRESQTKYSVQHNPRTGLINASVIVLTGWLSVC